MQNTIQRIQEAQRILLVGCSGGGKSTLARILGKFKNSPPIHLDQEFWLPGWQEPVRQEFRAKVEKIVKRQTWVIDGTFGRILDITIPQADLILFVDLPREICLYRAIVRMIKSKLGEKRLDMAKGCEEKIDFEFYRYIWNFKMQVNPKINGAIEENNMQEKTLRITSKKEQSELHSELSCLI